MVIGDFDYFNSYNFNPDVVSMFIGRYWFIMRFKYQSVWMVQIASPLTFFIPYKFMKVAW